MLTAEASVSSPQLSPLQVFQLRRLEGVLRRRSDIARICSSGDKLLTARLRGLDHAAYGLYQSCVAAGVRDAADGLLARYRPGS